jgi:hypothetical protein
MGYLVRGFAGEILINETKDCGHVIRKESNFSNITNTKLESL